MFLVVCVIGVHRICNQSDRGVKEHPWRVMCEKRPRAETPFSPGIGSPFLASRAVTPPSVLLGWSALMVSVTGETHAM